MTIPFRLRFADASRSLLVAALLLATLAIAAVLGWQVWREARSRQALAQRLLNDYAGTASWEFARRSERALLIGLDEALLPLRLRIDNARAEGPEEPGEPAPSPPPRAAVSPYRIEPVVRAFRLPIDTAGLGPDAEGLPSEVRDAILRAVRVRMDGTRPSDGVPALALVGEGGNTRLFGYLVPLGRPRQIVGIETTAEGIGGVLSRVFERDPLLPPSLMQDANNRALVLVTVQDRTGRIIYRSSSEAHEAVATHALDARFGGLRVSAAVRPEAVDRLLAGSGAAVNWRTIALLLGLEVLLVVATLAQFQRQRELSRLRTEFVSAASHELRTPLAQIRLFTETLRLGRVRSESEGRRALEIIDQETRRLSNLVENVLLFSRRERGLTRLVPVPTELVPVVAGVLETFEPLARARSVDVVLRAPETGLAALIDRAAVQQVLLNLLDNAVKYGPAGQTVTVTVVVADSRGPVRLIVDDEGPGIPAADRDRIWQPFYRSSRERSSAVAGTGIGLSVVHELVTQQGGKVHYEPRPEGGSRFVVELRGVGDGLPAPGVPVQA